MKTASAYKALWDGDKQFLSAIAKEVATLVAVRENMDYFRKQLTEFTDKWQAYKTAYEADRKGEWQPSTGRPKNPLGTIWPLVYGSGWKDGAEKLLPGGPGINLLPYYPCRDIKAVLGACAILAVIQDNILPKCPPIAKNVLPKKLSQEIWRNLITGVDIEDTIGPGPRSVIRRHKIAGFLIDVRANIGQDATALSEVEKIFFNKYSQAYKKLLGRANKNDDGGKPELAKATENKADLGQSETSKKKWQDATPSITETQNMIKLFISHSSKDQELVEKLIELVKNALRLSSSEIRCTTIDGYRLPGGANTNEQIKREVRDSIAFIGLISAAATDSMYVLFELGARWGSDKHLLPLLALGVSPDILQGPLSNLNALSCSNGSQLHQLVKDLAETLKIQPETPDAYQRYIDEIPAISPSVDKIPSGSDQVEVPPATSTEKLLTYPGDITNKLIWWLGQQRGFVFTQTKCERPVVWHFNRIDEEQSLTPGSSKEYLPKILNSNESPFPAIVENVSADTIRLKYDFSP